MHPNQIVFSKQDIELIVDMYCVQNKSMRFIALEFNCSKQTIKKALLSNRVAIRGSETIGKIEFSEKERADILRKHELKIPVYKIAKEYSCADSTIRTCLKKWGVTLISSRPKLLVSIEELKSKKYGTLSVLEEVSASIYARRVLCQCDCGNRKIININSLRRGDTITCGDSSGHDRSGKSSKTFAGYETVTGSIVNRFRKGAVARNIEFNVTAKYLYDLFVSQGESCALSGIKLILPTHSKKANKGNASLDRIDSSLGYIEGNLQWIFKPLNCMKYTLGQDEFINYCKIIAEFQTGKPSPNFPDSSRK